MSAIFSCADDTPPGHATEVRFTGVLVVLAVLGGGHVAFAHDVRGEVVFLDVGDRTVDVELRVPVLQLALARQERVEGLLAEPADRLAGDARAFVALRDPSGTAFAQAVRRITPARDADGGQMIVFALRFTPPAGSSARWFELEDGLVLHSVVTDNIYVFLRRDLQSGALGGSPSLVGTMHYPQRRLVVDQTAGSWTASLAAAFRLGVDHIRAGTDHLLFLLMLLVVAPLAAARRSWTHATTARRGLVRTAGIATAFTVGHSITLVLGALVHVPLPSRVVEVAIAVSIFVSALHAWRPLFAGKEAYVAAGFGLVHGLAFAGALAGFGFDRPSLVLALLGFNLGVEAMQLVVIALIVPSLMLLALGARYPHFRRAASALAIVASLGWLVERLAGLTLVSPVLDRIAVHGSWLVVALAVGAFVSWKATSHEQPDVALAAPRRVPTSAPSSARSTRTTARSRCHEGHQSSTNVPVTSSGRAPS